MQARFLVEEEKEAPFSLCSVPCAAAYREEPPGPRQGRPGAGRWSLTHGNPTVSGPWMWTAWSESVFLFSGRGDFVEEVT